MMKTDSLVNCIALLENIHYTLTREMDGDVQVNYFLSDIVKFQVYLEDKLNERKL